MATANIVQATVYDGSMDNVLVIKDASNSAYRIASLPRPQGAFTFTIWVNADTSTRIILSVLGKIFVIEGINAWNRHSFTIENPTKNYIDVMPLKNSQFFLYKALLEEGTVPSDWVPAQEDTDSDIEAAKQEALRAQQAADTNTASIARAIENFNSQFDEMETQIDGKVDSWFYAGTPGPLALPEKNWSTTAEKAKHVDDLYYDTRTGYCYHYTSAYKWERIMDSDITSAMNAAAAADSNADGRCRAFVSQPVPPYDVGDIWLQGTSGDIMRCQTARSSGSYYASDWVKASKYTDDTAVVALANRVSTAEQKITDDAIVNTVTSSTTYQGLVTRVSTAETKITDSAIVATIRGSTEYGNDLGSIRGTANDAVSTVARIARLDTEGLHIGDESNTNNEVLIDSEAVNIVTGGQMESKFAGSYIQFGLYQLRKTADGGLAFKLKEG